MASSTSSADATSSSVTLASLPAELHSAIARMCRDQDRRYKERTAPAVGAPQLEVAKAGATEWDGRSLNALFLVSKAWSQAAATYLFETISAKRCAEPFFVLSIAPERASVIHHASFDGPTKASDGRLSLLRSLPILTCLRRLTLTRSAFVNLVGSDPSSTPSAEQQLHRQALLRCLRTLLELSLEDVDAQQLAWALAPLSDSPLQHLDLVLDFTSEDADNARVTEARVALQGLKQLRHLSFRDLDDHSSGLLDNASSFEFRLKSLELDFIGRSLDRDAWSLIEAFSSTLETLVLGLDDAGVEAVVEKLGEEAEGTSRTTLSALRHLSVEGTTSAITKILHLFSLSPIVTIRLNLMRYSHAARSDPMLDLAPLALKLWTTSLSQLEVFIVVSTSPSTCMRVSTTRELRNMISDAAPQVDFTAQPGPDAFYLRFKHPLYGLKQYHAAAIETLTQGVGFADRLLATEDVQGARALLKLLEPLRGKMLREKD